MRNGMDLSVGRRTRLTGLHKGQTLDQLITFFGGFLAAGHSTKISSWDFSLCKLNIIPFFSSHKEQVSILLYYFDNADEPQCAKARILLTSPKSDQKIAPFWKAFENTMIFPGYYWLLPKVTKKLHPLKGFWKHHDFPSLSQCCKLSQTTIKSLILKTMHAAYAFVNWKLPLNTNTSDTIWCKRLSEGCV